MQTEPEEEAIEKRKRASWHDALGTAQTWAHKRFPALVPHPRLKTSVEQARRHDAADNLRTTPPDDESIRLRCVWAAELYTPAHVTGLISSFTGLGWDKEDLGRPNSTPARWLRRFRDAPYGGGWYNLGAICRPGDTPRFFDARTAPLPPAVDYAFATMYSLSSSITSIVIGFLLREDYAARYDEILRRSYETRAASTDQAGFQILNPANQKAAAVDSFRKEFQAWANDWIASHLPGIFASGLIQDGVPTCEFLTFRRTQPFTRIAKNGTRERDWLMALNMHSEMDAWMLDRTPQVRWSWPLLGYEGSRFHAAVAVREGDLDEQKFRMHGNDPGLAGAIYVDRSVNRLLSRWSVLALLAGFESALHLVRDSTTPWNGARSAPTDILPLLQSNLWLSTSIATANADLAQVTRSGEAFEHDVARFTPVLPELFSDEQITLVELWRRRVHERAVRLKDTEQLIRDLLLQQGTVSSASQNIRLQTRIRLLTSVLVVLTVILVVLTLSLVKVGEQPLWDWLWQQWQRLPQLREWFSSPDAS